MITIETVYADGSREYVAKCLRTEVAAAAVVAERDRLHDAGRHDASVRVMTIKDGWVLEYSPVKHGGRYLCGGRTIERHIKRYHD